MMKDRDQSASERGFSLIEMLVVVALILVIAAMALPQIRASMDNMKLRSIVTDVNGLVQQDRIQSVRDNKSYTIKTAAAAGGNGITLFIDSPTTAQPTGNGVIDPGEPTIQLSTNMTITATGPGPLPPGVAGSALPYVTANTVTLSFNERGLPCLNPPVCGTVSPYVIYLSQTRPNGTGWAAITVTPSGRIKAYTYTGTAWQ